MSIDTAKVDTVLQYALLIAGDEDDRWERELGAIHLIKYVYLADLLYARAHGGATYTGTDWTFHNFGPWAQPVNARIEPALNAIHAERVSRTSDYADRSDWVRWNKTDERLKSQLEKELPFEIRVELKSLVHRYRKDTPTLLDFVYKTGPMLSAAPSEHLDFSLAGAVPTKAAATSTELTAELTARQQKKMREQLRALRERSAKAPKAAAKLVRPPPPRYDAVFVEGVNWLDKLAGQSLSEGNLRAEFSDEVWHSATRKGNDDVP